MSICLPRAMFLAALLSALPLGCGSGMGEPAPVKTPNAGSTERDARPPIICSVAASLRDVVEQAVGSHFDVDVKINSGPSSGLATQIEAGAPVDLFLSASAEWGAKLQERGLVAEVVPLLTNRLVLVVPKGNPARIQEPRDLEQSEVVHVSLAGESVPAGKYAGQALEWLGVLGGLASAGKIVRGQDVRAALAFVERGEAEAGIVYATDAKGNELVETVYEFPSDLHEPIEYVLVLLKHGQAKPDAVALFKWLQSPDATQLFEAAGFQPLTSSTTPSAE